MSLGDEAYTQIKNHRKRARMIFQLLSVLLLIGILIDLFFTLKTYRPYEAETGERTEDTGFIALSYFGIDRLGNTSTLVGERQLMEHLQALKDQGYVTITQADIEAYYKEGKQLPLKSLYIMFEDGRRDTAIFAQDILEHLNYKATMMTYPEKFEKHDPKFLQPKELKEMEESTFWEMGTNGYRLQYINVFDRYDNYIGEINPLKYAMMQRYLGRKYNHYLMDYIRDKHGMPKESRDHMAGRISYDYEKLRDVYTEELGYVPPTYVLMHANTGAFGNNPSVSAVNEKWIRELFLMNFNREGYCFNQRNSSIYDLTRMQPQPYWPINHLLMRIKYDINQPIVFVEGEKWKQRRWELLMGASECKRESYILTSLPRSVGLAKLKKESIPADIIVDVRLRGNSFGGQYLCLRANDDRSRLIRVGIDHGDLIVREKTDGGERELYKERIVLATGETEQISVEEARRNAEVGELETFARYADSPAQAKEYLARAEKRKAQPARTVAEGAAPYVPQQSFHARLDYHLRIRLHGEHILVSVDGEPTVHEMPVSVADAGDVYLMAGWDADAWSQRNLADDVYDGVFERIIIRENTGKAAVDDEKVLFTTEYSGWEKFLFQVNQKWESVLGFFLYDEETKEDK